MIEEGSPEPTSLDITFWAGGYRCPTILVVFCGRFSLILRQPIKPPEPAEYLHGEAHRTEKSFQNSLQADEDEGEDHERPIDVNGTLRADHEATKIPQPAESPFDQPAKAVRRKIRLAAAAG